MRFKQILVKSHLILGLISGIGVFIIAITGAIYAFSSEIDNLTKPFKKIEAQSTEMILPSEAIKIAQKANPGIAIHGVKYQDATDAIEIIYYQPEPFYYGAAYLNSYTGKVIKVENFEHTFFGFILRGHTSLWLPFKIGYPLVAVICIIFLIMLISGIVLWWPRKNSSSKSYSITRKKTSIRSLEIHKVVGFYSSFIALLLVLTGLTWLLQSFDKAIYKTIGGKKEIAWNPPLSDTTNMANTSFTGEAIDVLYQRIKAQHPEMKCIEMHEVRNSSSAILVELNRDPATNRKMDYLFYDQYSLELIETNQIYGRYDDAETADKIRRSYYDIHTGSILGLPGKFLAFFASLFSASLPITGFLLWWSRRKEKRAFLQKMEI